ncbi:hypothetical protein [Natronorubrum aibiense]|uniref:hypothetical protein n=1 Tax=Natronorubrum aibiense TaxID=348826 RepID=UPI0029CA10A7|nr:hypothetical protein [Natronorubrum aibiense]
MGSSQIGLVARYNTQVQDRYEIVCDRAAVDPLVPHRMQDLLGELAMLGIVSRTKRHKGKLADDILNMYWIRILICYSRHSMRQWTWWGVLSDSASF